MTTRSPALASITACLAMILLADCARADLVAHWKLDEISGTTAADSAGGDNTGTLNNGPAWVTGIIGGGLDFDGTDDYLNAPLTTIPTGVGSRTVALWFNADNVSTQGAKLFAYGDGSGTTGTGGDDPNPFGDAFTFTIEDGGLIYFRYSGGNNRYNLAGNTNLLTDTWYHLAAVLPDGATNSDEVLVYLNGSLANTTVIGAVQPLFTDPTPTAPDFYLGKEPTSAPCFDGTLDEVQVYDSALSATDIASLYNDPGSVISDTDPPSVVTLSPANGISGVPINIEPTATFSESIALITGGVLTLRNLADISGNSDEVIILPDIRVTASGLSLIIAPAADLQPDTSYAVRISGTAVEDLDGNPFPGIDDDETWNFTTGAAPPPTPPNVLFITFDDLNTRVGPLAEYPEMLTPHMNRLAADGVTFKRAYCQAPICGPSRVSFMSGLRPSTTGEYSLDSMLSNHPTYGAGSHKSLHEFYKDAGYTTASIGKIYHTPSDLGSWLDLGNGTHNYGSFPPSKLTSTAVSGTNRMADWGAFPANDDQLEDYGFVTWALDRIEDFSASPETPFFLSVGMTQPHLPLLAPQAWFDLYPLTPTLGFTRPFYDPNDLDDTPRIARYLHWSTIAPRTEKLIQYDEWDNHTRAYLACVSYADMNLGRLLDGLDDPNGDGDTSDSIRDNTIVVMFSDHGYHLGEKGMTSKRSLWDVGTRVPLIISAPGMAEGQMSTQPVELLDLYPTLLDLCGLGPYAPLEGLSLRPQLENPGTAPWRRPALTTSGPNNHAIVDERYRYIRYADGSEELYDHAIDPNEATNRINDPNFREVAARLAGFIPTVNTPHTPGEVSSIVTFGPGGVISYSGSVINDTELGINPAVANYVSPLAAESAVDLDEDLMPDWWEEHYTGTTTALTIDGNFDGDPVSDKDEYLHGTDPTDPDSYLRLSVEADPGGQSFRHTTVPGRDYRFHTSGDLKTWTTDGTPNPGTGDDVVRSSDSLGLPADRGFTRVEVLSEAESAP